MMTRFANVQRREPICDQAEALRLQRRKVEIAAAEADVTRALDAIFAGTSGQYARDRIDALIKFTAARATALVDGSFTNSRFGFHAGQQIKPARPATPAEVDAIFSRVANGVRRLRDEGAA